METRSPLTPIKNTEPCLNAAYTRKFQMTTLTLVAIRTTTTTRLLRFRSSHYNLSDFAQNRSRNSRSIRNYQKSRTRRKKEAGPGCCIKNMVLICPLLSLLFMFICSMYYFPPGRKHPQLHDGTHGPVARVPSHSGKEVGGE